MEFSIKNQFLGVPLTIKANLMALLFSVQWYKKTYLFVFSWHGKFPYGCGTRAEQQTT